MIIEPKTNHQKMFDSLFYPISVSSSLLSFGDSIVYQIPFQNREMQKEKLKSIIKKPWIYSAILFGGAFIIVAVLSS